MIILWWDPTVPLSVSLFWRSLPPGGVVWLSSAACPTSVPGDSAKITINTGNEKHIFRQAHQKIKVPCLLEMNNLIVHVLLLFVVTCTEAKACNTQCQTRTLPSWWWYHATLTIIFWHSLLGLSTSSTSSTSSSHVWAHQTRSLTIGASVEMFVFPHAEGLFEKLWCRLRLWCHRLGHI